MRIKQIKALIFLLILSSLGMQSLLADPVDDELIGHWRLDETSGTVASDSSDVPHDGVLGGGVTFSSDSVSGVIGGALHLDGIDDCILAPSAGQSLDTFTAALHVKFDSLSNVSQSLVARQNGSGTGRNYLYYAKGDGTIRSYIGGQATKSQFAPVVDQWYHIAVTYNNGVVRIYIDGEEKVSASRTEEDATGDFVFGAHKNLSKTFVDGTLDDIRIYSRELSGLEIKGISLETEGHWRLDDSSSPALDSSDNNHPGTWKNGVTSSSETSLRYQSGNGGSVYLDGDDDHIDMGHIPEISALRNSFTNTVRFKAANVTNTWTRLNGVTTVNSQNGWGVGYKYANPLFTTYGRMHYLATNITIVPGVWYFMATVMDSNNDVTFYLYGDDGSYQTEMIAGNLPAGIETDDSFLIGRAYAEGSHMEGHIDDVRVYGKELTSAEIALLAGELPGNSDPVLDNAIGDQVAVEDNVFNFTFASDTFSDADGDPLTYTASLSGGGALPGWLIFSSPSRTFSGTPGATDLGTLSIEVEADDGMGGTPATATFTLLVNGLPDLDNPLVDVSYSESDSINFTIPSNSFSDPESHSLTYSATQGDGSALPGWLTFTPASRSFTGTASSPGIYTIKVTADDGFGGLTSDTFDVTVDAAPTVLNPIADQVAIEDNADIVIDLSNVFDDADNDNALITKSVFSNSNPALLSAIINGNDLTLDFGTNTNGTATIVIRGTSNGLTVDDSFLVTVSPVDDAPQVANAIADVTVNEDATDSTIDLTSVFTDVDNDDLAITKAVQSNSNTSLVTASIVGNTLTLDYQGDAHGTATIVIRGTSNGLTVDDSFLVTVNPVDDAPQVANAIADVTVNEDAADSVIDLTSVFTDVDNDDSAITKAVQSNTNPSLVTASIVGNTLTLSYAPGMSGTATITVRGTSNGLTVDDIFLVTVNAVNDPPVVDNPIADQITLTDEFYDFTFAANTFSDPEGQTLSYTATRLDDTPLPGWLTFSGGNRQFTGTPTAPEVVNIKVTADDGAGGTVSEVFVLTVVEEYPNIFNQQGASGSDGLVDITGTTEPGAVVDLLAGGKVIATTTADSMGNFSFSGTEVPLEDTTLYMKYSTTAGTEVKGAARKYSGHTRIYSYDNHYRTIGFARGITTDDFLSALEDFSNVDSTETEDYESADYDASNNTGELVAGTGGVTSDVTFTHNEMNETTSIGTLRTNMVYDDVGRLVSYEETVNSVTTHYRNTWNVLDRLVKVETSADGVNYTEKVKYVYHADGMRASKKVTGGEHEHYYGVNQNIHEIYEVDAQNSETLTAEFVYESTDRPTTMFRDVDNNSQTGALGGREAYFYHTNRRGDVYALTDEAGVIVERYDYSLYGKPYLVDADGNRDEFTNSACYNPFLFGGVFYDCETRWYQMRHRYYDPTMRKFLTRDPLEDDSLGNLYAAFENNPGTRVDPMGLADAEVEKKLESQADSLGSAQTPEALEARIMSSKLLLRDVMTDLSDKEFIEWSNRFGRYDTIDNMVNRNLRVSFGNSVSMGMMLEASAYDQRNNIVSMAVTTVGTLGLGAVYNSFKAAKLVNDVARIDRMLTAANAARGGLIGMEAYGFGHAAYAIGTGNGGLMDYASAGLSLFNAGLARSLRGAGSGGNGNIHLDSGTMRALVAQNSPVRHNIKSLIGGRNIVASRTALNEFNDATKRLAGPLEKARASRLLKRLNIVNDSPSLRAQNLRITKKVGANDKIIFGTADEFGQQIITSDAKFLRGASAQGVEFDALLHDPFSFLGK